MKSTTYRNLTITALLMALAIMIPIVMPLKVVIPPASYTLGILKITWKYYQMLFLL